MINLFSTPLLKINLNLDNLEIKNFINYIFSKDKGRNYSNMGGWQSNNITDFNKEFELLKKSILQQSFLYCKEINLEIFENLKINQIWANVNKYKDFNLPHLHLNASLSGVYYVDVNDKSGNIVFTNNNNSMLFLWQNIKRKYFDENNSNAYSFLPKNGDLIIFPAWANHYVEPNLSEKDRISISFDLA